MKLFVLWPIIFYLADNCFLAGQIKNASCVIHYCDTAQLRMPYRVSKEDDEEGDGEGE